MAEHESGQAEPKGSEPRTLVEHYFRHQYGRLVALLTRRLGIRNLELAEDAVQGALSRALQLWARHGIPDDPNRWLYRVANNLAIDALRRQQVENRILGAAGQEASQSGTDEPSIEEHEIVEDAPLRMLFLCSHPSVPLESRVAFALKSVSGFSTDEVASALLISKVNAEKRVTRARKALSDLGIELNEMNGPVLRDRLEAVQATIYLLYNEGYASSASDSLLRKDLCNEAIRLTRMLLRQSEIQCPSNDALLALLLMHSARFNARVHPDGRMIGLEEQDRGLWDWNAIREAMEWMARSARGDTLSRYHVEVAIAWEHCRAANFESIDWCRVHELYEVLLQISPGPMVQLNRAIAASYAMGPEAGLKALVDIDSKERSRIRPWWDCALANCYVRIGKIKEAIAHWNDALALAISQTQRNWIAAKIEAIHRKSD